LLGVALLLGCATLEVPEERRIGEEIARQVRGELPFIRDAVVLDYVREIGTEIAQASGPHAFPFHFEVVEDEEINAFAAPGGYVYVHTGTILKARNVSELASVLAHEIGHVALRHVADNYERQVDAGRMHQLGVLAASVFGFGAIANVGGALATMAILNSFTRADEREADAYALGVLPSADYDPHGLLSFLAVVRAEAGGAGGAFLSTHPAPSDRVDEAEALLVLEPPPNGLRVTDGGKLEIIQRRIELLTRKTRPPTLEVEDSTGLEPL
jgi:predicted Zn-dependent protease